MRVLIVEDTVLKYVKIKRVLEGCQVSTLCHEKTLEDAKKRIEQSPIIICSSGRFPLDKENVLGSVYYSDQKDWQTEFRKLLGTIPLPPKQ